MRALILTRDPLLLTAFTEASTELGIEAHASEDLYALSCEWNNTKYEGLVLDFDTMPAAISIIGSVRKSRSNKSAVIFAVASDSRHRDQALFGGVHFLLQRPIQKTEITRTLNAAYDLMRGERRLYFRCTVELPVSLTRSRSGETLECSTINLSNNGMGIHTPVTLDLGENLNIALSLPTGTMVSATGIVIWDDKHGKCGITYRCGTREMRQSLDAWLDDKFARVGFARE